MKKFIAAAAGLALAGTMATTAMAEVNFGGDARVRMITKQDYVVDGSASYLDSRVRLKVEAKSKGGASASARIRMADGMWDGGAGATGNAAADKNIYVDYAYLSVPMGPVTVSAGRQIASFSPWFAEDGRKDRLKIAFKGGTTTVVGFYDKNAELTDQAPTATATWDATVNGATTTVGSTVTQLGYTSNDWTSDNDQNGYGIVVIQGIGSVTAKGIAVYLQDSTPVGNNGIVGSVNVSGKAGTVGYAVEVSAKDFDNAADTQFGGYASVSAGFGAVSITGIAGMTVDGFMADDDFGTHMIGNGNNSPITIAPQIGVGGDTVFGVAVVGFQASPQLALNGILTYATIDNFANLFEVSGGASYTISDGAALTVAAGAVVPSDEGGLAGDEETRIGAYAKLEIKY